MLQILMDPDVYERIDEFYFEHHVKFEPLSPNWKDNIAHHQTLKDTYRMFSELRARGVRVHGWP
jgi:hypothetical protein